MALPSWQKHQQSWKKATYCDSASACRPQVLHDKRLCQFPWWHNLNTEPHDFQWLLHTDSNVLMLKRNTWGCKLCHLSQGTLHLSQEVCVFHAGVVSVNVVHLKLQLLHHLKVVVNHERLGKCGIKAVVDFLCAANLTETYSQSPFAYSLIQTQFFSFRICDSRHWWFTDVLRCYTITSGIWHTINTRTC